MCTEGNEIGRRRQRMKCNGLCYADVVWAALGRYEGLHHGSSYLEHMEFALAVHSHGKHPPAVGLEAGLLAVAVGVAAHQSIDHGRFVTLQEILGRRA